MSGATISDDARYRYRLWRGLQGGDGVCLFVMLNPSTADAQQDDPTIRRCIGFAKSWGYGCLEVVNLYGLRSTDPKALWRDPDPVGPCNDETIYACHRRADRVVVAWGAVPSHCDGRVSKVMGLLSDKPVHCLGETKAGSPRHPLYVKGSQEPQVYIESFDAKL